MKQRLYFIKSFCVNYRLMLSVILDLREFYLAYVNYVRQYIPDLNGRPAPSGGIFHFTANGVNAFSGKKQGIDFFYIFGFGVIYDKLTINIIVPVREVSAAVKISRLAPAYPSHCKTFGNLILFKLGKHR